MIDTPLAIGHDVRLEHGRETGRSARGAARCAWLGDGRRDAFPDGQIDPGGGPRRAAVAWAVVRAPKFRSG